MFVRTLLIHQTYTKRVCYVYRAPDAGHAAAGRRRLAQRWQLLALAEHRAELVAALGHPVQHRPDREAIGPQRRIVEFVPGDRRRDRGARRGAWAVGRDEGFVVNVLGVVEPGQAAPVLDVPFPADQLGHDRADRLGQLLGPGAGVAEGQPGSDRYPDLDAAPPGDLRRRPYAEVLQRRAVQPGQDEHVVPGSDLAGVDIDEGVGRAGRIAGAC